MLSGRGALALIIWALAETWGQDGEGVESCREAGRYKLKNVHFGSSNRLKHYDICIPSLLAGTESLKNSEQKV